MEYPALERLAQLAEGLDGLQSRVSQRVEQLRAESVQVTSASKAVQVTVDHAGRVEQIEIASRGMRYSAGQLGEEITETVQRAQQEASSRLRDSMREVLGNAADDYPMD